MLTPQMHSFVFIPLAEAGDDRLRQHPDSILTTQLTSLFLSAIYEQCGPFALCRHNTELTTTINLWSQEKLNTCSLMLTEVSFT
jgi:hypothetical protein